MDINIQSLFYFLGSLLFCFIAWGYLKLIRLIQNENSILRNPIQISLDQEDFSCLVRGGILTIAKADQVHSYTIRLALKDIGFYKMQAELASAELGNDIYKEHKKILSN